VSKYVINLIYFAGLVAAYLWRSDWKAQGKRAKGCQEASAIGWKFFRSSVFNNGTAANYKHVTLFADMQIKCSNIFCMVDCGD